MEPILLVEDDSQLRATLTLALEDEGFAVAAARDGRGALDWLLGHQPALVLLDWRLPDFDGEFVASGLRRTYGHSVPVVLITADAQAAQKAERVGAQGYLQKPFDLQELISLVRNELQVA
jgi:DNA-binding response OmpR family regulator